ncbi:MAG: hypothetical protein B6U69_01635 [Thermofilum sp. ex4484_15]|nr:MAG: hypothetical protein B6U69_01635 [Thermofilum sp. ex4484_15]
MSRAYLKVASALIVLLLVFSFYVSAPLLAQAQVPREGKFPIPGLKGYYIVYKGAVPPNKSRLIGFSTIGPAFYSNVTLDALLYAAKYETDPILRTKLYNIIQRISNKELPIIWLGQARARRHYWEWVKLPFFNPVLAMVNLIFVSKDPNGPKPDKLIVLDIDEPESLDPAQTYETGGWGFGIQIYNRLVFYYGNDSKNVVPELAYAWAMDPSGLHVYFAIRDGIVFYDPWDNKTIPLTPKDVVYSIKRMIESANYEKKDYPEWIIKDFVKDARVVPKSEMTKIISKGLIAPVLGRNYRVTSIPEWLYLFREKFAYVPWHRTKTKIAGYVEITLYKPYLAILACLASNVGDIVSEKVVAMHNSTKDPLALKWLDEHPVGTGAYYLVEWKHERYLKIRANPYYWGYPKPKIKEYISKIVPEEQTRIMVLSKGDADMGAVFPASEYKLEHVTLTYKGKTWHFLMPWVGDTFDILFIVLNNMRAPFNNTLVRRALAYAIPYEFIYKNVFRKHYEPLYGVLPRGMPGYTEKGLIKYTYNITKAKELIKKSGIDPSKYTITILYNQGNKIREMIATLLQREWGRLGFNVKVKALAWPTYLRKTSRGEFDVYIVGWAPDYVDPDDYAYPLLWGGWDFSEVKVVKG